MNKNWFNVALYVVQAVQLIQRTVHDTGKTKKEKAIVISDAVINALEGSLEKEILSDPTVVKTRSALIDAVAAFENAVSEANFNLKSDKTNG